MPRPEMAAMSTTVTIEQLKKAAHLKAEVVAELVKDHGIPAEVALQIINQEAAQIAAMPRGYGL